VVEPLPNKFNALNSNSSNATKKREKEREKKKKNIGKLQILFKIY
jgi:hypothetical protein